MITFSGTTSLRKLLCLGAHSDDIEIGAGGTILRMIAQSPRLEVRWVCFSGNGVRRAEAFASAGEFLRRTPHVLRIEDFSDTRFPEHRGRIKDVFGELQSFDPDLVLTHRLDDLHQDHRVIAELTWNTFRAHQVWEYEIPKWDGDVGRPNLYVPFDKSIADRKVEVLMSCFTSQRSKHWFDEELFRGLMRLRGMECNSVYAEGFVAKKMVL